MVKTTDIEQSDEAVYEKAQKRSKITKIPEKRVLVHWVYTKRSFVEVFDEQKRKMVVVPVTDDERKIHKEVVKAGELTDNGFQWMARRNEDLLLARRNNSIRILKMEPMAADGTVDDDVIVEGGLQAAIKGA